jgi:hypothetical protein
MTFGARFFASPGRLSGRADGDAWGAASVALDFAGGPYLFDGLSRAQEAAVHERFAGFCSSSSRPPAAVACRVLRAAPEEFLSFDLRGWEMTLDFEHTPESVCVAGLDLMARVEWRPTLSAAVWTASDGGPAFTGILENVFRVLVAYRLLEIGGLLLHSTALAREDRVWVLVGRSGAGKSTLSRLGLAQGGAVLSDDLNALVPARGGFVVEGVPFAGDHRAPKPERRALAGLGLLEQGRHSGLTPLARAQALAGILSGAPYVNQDPHRLDSLVGNVDRLLRAGPVGRFTFALGADVWSHLREPASA